MTNADTIRTMTDEELAEWLGDRGCDYCPARKLCIEQLPIDCKRSIMVWMKQEVQE